MIECRRRAGFLLEPAQPFTIRCERSRQDLDGDIPFQSRVPGAVDLAHAPAPHQVQYRVAAQRVSRLEAASLSVQGFTHPGYGRPCHKAAGLAMSGQERFDFPAKFLVRATLLLEVFLALLWRELQRGIEKLLHSL